MLSGALGTVLQCILYHARTYTLNTRNFSLSLSFLFAMYFCIFISIRYYDLLIPTRFHFHFVVWRFNFFDVAAVVVVVVVVVAACYFVPNEAANVRMQEE